MIRTERLAEYRLETHVRCEIGPREPKSTQPRQHGFLVSLGIVLAVACGLGVVCALEAFWRPFR